MQWVDSSENVITWCIVHCGCAQADGRSTPERCSWNPVGVRRRSGPVPRVAEATPGTGPSIEPAPQGGCQNTCCRCPTMSTRAGRGRRGDYVDVGSYCGVCGTPHGVRIPVGTEFPGSPRRPWAGICIADGDDRRSMNGVRQRVWRGSVGCQDGTGSDVGDDRSGARCPLACRGSLLKSH